MDYVHHVHHRHRVLTARSRLWLLFAVNVARTSAAPCIANGFVVLGFKSMGTAGRCTWDSSLRFANRVSSRFDCRGPALFPDQWGPSKMKYWDEKFCGPGLLRAQGADQEDALAPRGIRATVASLRGHGTPHAATPAAAPHLLPRPRGGGGAVNCGPVAEPDGGISTFSKSCTPLTTSARLM